MTLQMLKYFIETVKYGSISKAAEQLFIAQSSLSVALRSLEAEIGHKLFYRTSKGVSLTRDGEEFLLYARQVLEQTALLEERWVTRKPLKPRLLIISQHYAFAIKAFINMAKKNSIQEYDYILKEGRLLDIIDEVRLLRSEIGILYIDGYNRMVIEKMLREGGLEFHPLFTAKPYVLISVAHPLAGSEYLTSEDLIEFPRVSFEQSDYNALYFQGEGKGPNEDALVKSISIGDRGMMCNLLLELNAYTITTGLQGIDLYGDDVVAIPLRVEDEASTMEVGWISCKDRQLTDQAEQYVEELTAVAME